MLFLSLLWISSQPITEKLGSEFYDLEKFDYIYPPLLQTGTLEKLLE